MEIFLRPFARCLALENVVSSSNPPLALACGLRGAPDRTFGQAKESTPAFAKAGTDAEQK
jgi:hypothetical protein